MLEPYIPLSTSPEFQPRRRLQSPSARFVVPSARRMRRPSALTRQRRSAMYTCPQTDNLRDRLLSWIQTDWQGHPAAGYRGTPCCSVTRSGPECYADPQRKLTVPRFAHPGSHDADLFNSQSSQDRVHLIV